MSALASMRIEPADQDPRPGDAEFFYQIGVQYVCHTLQALCSDGGRHILERQVGGDQCNPQPARGQHHDDLLGARQLREKLGVS